MPKRRKIVADWGPETPAGLPHGSNLVREARNHPRTKRDSLEGEGKSPDKEKDCPATEGRQAKPDKEYLVGGTVVRGREFLGGTIPANARRVPSPHSHVVKPNPSLLEKFKRAPEPVSMNKEAAVSGGRKEALH